LCLGRGVVRVLGVRVWVERRRISHWVWDGQSTRSCRCLKLTLSLGQLAPLDLPFAGHGQVRSERQLDLDVSLDVSILCLYPQKSTTQARTRTEPTSVGRPDRSHSFNQSILQQCLVVKPESIRIYSVSRVSCLVSCSSRPVHLLLCLFLPVCFLIRSFSVLRFVCFEKSSVYD
jgi:hypothetical protein